MSEETNPWELISSRTVYENPWLRVEDHAVINPSGGKGQYGKVCFKNRAVAIIALDQDDIICLVGQYRYTLNAYSWELPMGGAAFDEEAQDAARRELREETGLSAARWTETLRLHTSNSVTDEEGFVFLAEELTRGEANPEETEALTVRFLPFNEALAWVLDGRITDAVSAAGLLHLAAIRTVRGRAQSNQT